LAVRLRITNLLKLILMRLRDQFRAKELLEKLYRTERVQGALLLHGPEGVGKTTAAVEFSRGVLCLKGEVWGCGECPSCLHFAHVADAVLEGRWEEISLHDERNGRKVFLYLMGDHPDFVFLPPSGQSIRIDQIRALREFIPVKPALSPRKVVVIDDAHLMTRESANALLKTLEEPPPNTLLVLTARSRDALLPTVLSRTYPVAFAPLDAATLRELLPELEEDICELSGGSYTRAKTLREKRELLGYVEDFLRGDPLRVYEIAQRVEKLEVADRLLFVDLVEEKAPALLSQKGLGYDRVEMFLERLSELREGIPRGIRMALALTALSALVEDTG